MDRGVPATAVSPGSAWRTESGAISASGQDQVRALLSSGVVPVLHGDCVPDASSGGTVLSGDALVRELAAGLRPEYVVFVTDVDGVMTRPPGEDGAEIMPEITVAEDGSWDIGSVQMTCAEHDATGGMRAKVQEAAAVARLGVPVLIVRWGSESCRRAMLAGPDACGDEGFRGTAVVPRRMSHAAAGAGSRERWQAATTLDRGMWGTPDVTWNVRGPNYLKDKKKVTAGQPAYQLVAVDLIRTPKDKVTSPARRTTASKTASGNGPKWAEPLSVGHDTHANDVVDAPVFPSELPFVVSHTWPILFRHAALEMPR